ncbi:MAG: hypothetical protein MJE68_17240, partial [Proteobacteria bacterium]|nr:hypothetical protein [Pseudomonadota bacterium]
DDEDEPTITWLDERPLFIGSAPKSLQYESTTKDNVDDGDSETYRFAFSKPPSDAYDTLWTFTVNVTRKYSKTPEFWAFDVPHRVVTFRTTPNDERSSTAINKFVKTLEVDIAKIPTWDGYQIAVVTVKIENVLGSIGPHKFVYKPLIHLAPELSLDMQECAYRLCPDGEVRIEPKFSIVGDRHISRPTSYYDSRYTFYVECSYTGVADDGTTTAYMSRFTTPLGEQFIVNRYSRGWYRQPQGSLWFDFYSFPPSGTNINSVTTPNSCRFCSRSNKQYQRTIAGDFVGHGYEDFSDPICVTADCTPSHIDSCPIQAYIGNTTLVQ